MYNTEVRCFKIAMKNKTLYYNHTYTCVYLGLLKPLLVYSHRMVHTWNSMNHF